MSAKCDKVDNLWLNVIDGMILCGRKNWDGTGGNDHTVEHYNETKYPLAVKLGTITTDLETTGKSLIDSLLEFGFFLFSVHCKISNKIKVIMAIKINPKLDK